MMVWARFQNGPAAFMQGSEAHKFCRRELPTTCGALHVIIRVLVREADGLNVEGAVF